MNLDIPKVLYLVEKTNIYIIRSLGWWKYDARTSSDLEAIYDLGEAQYELMICGELYVIDLQNLCQYKKYQPHRKRKIKRDLNISPCKGVAGVR